MMIVKRQGDAASDATPPLIREYASLTYFYKCSGQRHAQGSSSRPAPSDRVLHQSAQYRELEQEWQLSLAVLARYQAVQ